MLSDLMPQITNTLWGSLFCLPTGFSFTALRISTLAAAWLALVGAYLLMRQLRQPPCLALLAAITLAANPIFYALSNTFMTDVPFIPLMLFAAIFFVKYLRDDSRLAFILGTMLALASVLSRQVGLAVPLAFGVVLILQRGFSWRTILRAVTPAALCLTALLGFEHWMAATGRLPALYNFQNTHLLKIVGHPAKLAGVLANSIYLSLMYLGLFLSPVLLTTLPTLKTLCADRKLARAGWVFGALAMLTLAHGLCGKGFLMPMAGNILNETGIGPLTLRDIFILHIHQVPVLPTAFWAAVTFISLCGATALAMQLSSITISLVPRLRLTKPNDDECAGIFLLLVCAIYMLPFLVAGFLDRYLIPIIPFLAAGILSISLSAQPAAFKPGFRLPALLLAGFALFSLCGTRDYLMWNRVRWQALDELMKQKVPPSDIDGGFEFNGYYLYRPNYPVNPEKSSWWVENDTYLLSFQKIPSLTVLHEYPYAHWMPPYHGRIYVLEKQPDVISTTTNTSVAPQK